MKRYVFITLKVLLICVLTFSVFRLASLGAGLVRDRDNLEKLKIELEQVETVQPDTGDVSDTQLDESRTQNIVEETKPDENDISRKEDNTARFAAFTNRNSDFAGWIKIDGTVIDYPVMYSPDDPDYYLHHDFDKNESKSGVPYIGKNCSENCDNTIIYAHNMKNGTMFAGLLKYTDESFFRSHPEICFDTLEEDGIYDIIAVFRERVHYKDETDVFRYYNYCGELTEDQFNEYIAQIKNISLYDTGITAVYGQKLITLSTCSYHTENGRFVVVAVKR